MISFYTSVWFFAALWWPLRRKIQPVNWWLFALLLLPMAIDGGTHAISDLAGIGLGFRDSNEWLSVWTNQVFSPSFYAGDALGSFNAWARLVTGLLAGLAITWRLFPFIFQSQSLNDKLQATNQNQIIAS